MTTAIWVTVGVLAGVLLTIAASMIRDSWRNASRIIDEIEREDDQR